MAKAQKKPVEQPENDLSLDLLLQEVNDEVRAEKLRQLWQRFGSMVVGGCVAIVLATIAYQLATSYRHSQAEKATAILLEAQSLAEKGQVDTALKTLEPLAKESSAAGQLAALQAAYLQKDQKNSMAGFEALAAQDKNPLLKDLALVQLGRGAELGKDSTYYPLAAEQQAVALLQAGKKEEARTLIQSLLDSPDITPGQSARLQELLQGAGQ